MLLASTGWRGATGSPEAYDTLPDTPSSGRQAQRVEQTALWVWNSLSKTGVVLAQQRVGSE